jgi:hypothetical protein
MRADRARWTMSGPQATLRSDNATIEKNAAAATLTRSPQDVEHRLVPTPRIGPGRRPSYIYKYKLKGEASPSDLSRG